MKIYNIYREQRISVDEGCTPPETSGPEIIRVCLDDGTKTLLDSELSKLDRKFKPEKSDKVISSIAVLASPKVDGLKPRREEIWKDFAEYTIPTAYDPLEEYTVVIRRNVDETDLTKILQDLVVD